MENLSVNTTTPTVKTPNPASIMRMDTLQKDAIDKTTDTPKLTAQLNKVAESKNLDISFGYNEKINKIIINVMNKNMGEVIRKLPSDDAVKFSEGIENLHNKLFNSKG